MPQPELLTLTERLKGLLGSPFSIGPQYPKGNDRILLKMSIL